MAKTNNHGLNIQVFVDGTTTVVSTLLDIKDPPSETVPPAVSTCAHPISRFMRVLLNITTKTGGDNHKSLKGTFSKMLVTSFWRLQKMCSAIFVSRNFCWKNHRQLKQSPPDFLQKEITKFSKNKSGVFSEPVDTYGSELGPNSTKWVYVESYALQMIHLHWALPKHWFTVDFFFRFGS